MSHLVPYNGQNNNNNIINKDKNKIEEQYNGEKYNKRSECPHFLLKLYQILEKDENKDIIHWSDDGKSFIVKNLHDFTENILPQYFKHNNYSSFIRQLNMYDFHKKKSGPNEHIFEHKNFIKDKKELLKLIKRKSKKENNIKLTNKGEIFFPFNNNFLPNKTNNFIQIMPNYIIANNKEKNSLYNNKNKNSSFSLDDNLSQNSINAFNQFKQVPIALLPSGTSNDSIKQNESTINKTATINNNINMNNNNQEILINGEKKVTKKNLTSLLSYLIQSIHENAENQKQLELKVERLTKQNEEFIFQNKKILQEILSKNEYNQKLEAIICFVLEMITSKSKVKNNQELNNLFISNEENNQYPDNKNINKLGIVNLSTLKQDMNGIFANNNSKEILGTFQSFIGNFMERTKKNSLLTNKENDDKEIIQFNNNNNLLMDENNINNQEQNYKVLKNNLIGNKNEEQQIAPYMMNHKRKRSSSFNSVLSNLSKGSKTIINNNNNLYNNNNKSLKENENSKNSVKEGKLEDENNQNFSIGRKDSMSSWSEAKNIFDFNPDENKSFLSGWNKDILNNSQSSINDIYNNNMGKNTDLFNNKLS